MRICLVSALCGIASYCLLRTSLASAVTSNESAYVLTRSETIPFFTLHTLLNRAAIVPPALGLAVLACGRDSRLISGVRTRYTYLAYCVVLAGGVGFCAVLGNKSELFTAAVAGYLLYLANARRPRIVGLHVTGVLAFLILVLIDIARAMPILDVLSGLTTVSLDDVLQNAKSNEAFGSHFSMYGVLKFEVPLTYGSSVVSFVSSIIPRDLWPDRPATIYTYYADSLGFLSAKIDGQGYSIHHATGWFLNFGMVGVLVGGVILGLVWGSLYNACRRAVRSGVHRNRWFDVFVRVCPWTFTATIPSLVRGGPEIYKGVILEALVIPTIVLGIAAIHCSNGVKSRSGCSVAGRYPRGRLASAR